MAEVQVKRDLNDRIEELRRDPEQLTREAPAWTGRLGDYIDQAFTTFMARRENGARIPFPSDWEMLRKTYRGGFLPGLHILVGTTGSGKTQMALQMALAAARGGHSVGILALEADADYADLVARMSSLYTLEPWSDIYTGRRESGDMLSPDELKAVKAAAMEELPILPIFPLRMNPEAVEAASISQLACSFREQLAGDKERPALLVLDYLQRVKGRAGDDVRATIGNLSGTLRKLATEQNLAILALSSTARDKYAALTFDNGKPLAESLVGSGKESGEIEYDADSVLVLAKEGNKASGQRNLVAVAKQRAGRGGWVEDMSFNGHRWAKDADAHGATGTESASQSNRRRT